MTRLAGVLLSLTLLAGPLAAEARQAAMPVIGRLGSASPDLFASHLRTFRQGLSEAGCVESRNVTIEYCWAEGHHDRFLALAAGLVRHQVSYGASLTDTHRQAGVYTGRILKGEKPATCWSSSPGKSS